MVMSQTTCKLWPPPDGPAGHHGDHDLGHETNQALHFEDMQSAQARGIDLAGRVALVLVAILAADPLVTARRKRPAAVFGRRPIAGQEHAADIRASTGVLERCIQLIHGLRPKGVAHLGPVERYTHGAAIHGLAVAQAIDGAMVGHVLKIEARDLTPALGVENGRNSHFSAPVGVAAEATTKPAVYTGSS